MKDEIIQRLGMNFVLPKYSIYDFMDEIPEESIGDRKIKRYLEENIKGIEYHPAFHMDELSHVAITFHSSKGLEFEQVIVFANDYALNKPDSIYNHYVAVTRARSKLIIVRLSDINDWAGNLFYQNLEKLFGKAGVVPSEVMTIV